MAFYFTQTRVPELAALPDDKRSIVRRGAAEMFRKENPAFMVVAGCPGLGAIFFSFLFYYLLQLFYSGADRSAVAWLGGAVGVVVGSKIGKHIFFVFMRPYYRRYIEGHRDEISQAAS
jgi:hypothetical protein